MHGKHGIIASVCTHRWREVNIVVVHIQVVRLQASHSTGITMHAVIWVLNALAWGLLMLREVKSENKHWFSLCPECESCVYRWRQ